MKETPYELLNDNEKKQLGKNEKAKMTIYNALPRKEYERVFMCKTAKEVWHTLITTHQGNSKLRISRLIFSLKNTRSSQSPMKKLLIARAKVTDIEEAKDLATLPLDELIRNLKVYGMVLDNDGVDLRPPRKGGNNEDIDEEEAEAFNLLARNFRKFFLKGNRFRRRNQFGNGENQFGKGRGHFASDCRKPKENKAFMGGTWSDSEDGDEHQNDVTCLMAITSQEIVSKPSSSNIDLNIIDLQKENEELIKFNKDFTKTFEKILKEKRALFDKNSKLSNKINDLEIEVKKRVNDKEVVEPCKTCDVLTKEVNSSKCNVSRLQDEALKFSKFKESSIALDDMLSRQKLSQDKEGLGFSKNDKTTSASPNKPIVFVKESKKDLLNP
nr:hypothetical protein [Tanacetum cinerariifolium]